MLRLFVFCDKILYLCSKFYYKNIMALINCDECGAQISDKAPNCPRCGTPVEKHIVCEECGVSFVEKDGACPQCGCPVAPPRVNIAQQTQLMHGAPSVKTAPGVFDNGPSGKSRGVAALLALFFGSLGVHLFYVGKIGAGVLFLLCTLIGWVLIFPPFIVAVVSLIQTIMLFTMSSDDFEAKYINSNTFLPV